MLFVLRLRILAPLFALMNKVTNIRRHRINIQRIIFIRMLRAQRVGYRITPRVTDSS